MTLQELENLLTEPESTNLEFKKAANQYSREKLCRYIAALANEGGGFIVLGVDDGVPHRVIGTDAFPDVHSDLNNLRQALSPPPALKAEEPDHPDGRVVVFRVGSRPRGQAVRYKRIPWARLGESLTEMSDDDLRAILLEDVDASSELCPGANLEDLDEDAIEVLRQGVVAKTIGERQKERYATVSSSELLSFLGLSDSDGTLSKAAILLLGTENALRRWARNAEIIFEYRRSPKAIRYDRRETFRRAILLAIDNIWEMVQPYALEDPLEVSVRTRVVQRPRYPERSIREALLNAVTHRDYHNKESVVVRMSPDTFEVTSPGPFPANITPQNIAEEQYRRNRILAEALEKCGQIERSGQGVDLMIQAAVQQAQALPRFEETYGNVRVTLFGDADLNFLRFTQRIPPDRWDRLSIRDLRTLDAVRRRVPRTQLNPTSVAELIDLDILRMGQGGTLLPDESIIDPDAEASLLASLSPEGLQDRIWEQLRAAGETGLALRELRELFPDQTDDQIQSALQEMKGDRVEVRGRTKGARWVAIVGVD